MSRRTLCLTLAALLSASAALAQTPSAPPSGSRPVDAKADGVDLTTFQARHRSRLMRADTDHDGRISEAEWTAWWAAHPGKGPADPLKRFQRLDVNGDGFVTAEEVDTAFAKRFAKLDADHDGRITRAERPCRCR